MRFWDSSALVPLVVQQDSSPVADAWLADDSDVAVWSMTSVELTSAIWRLFRDGRITERDALRAEDRAQDIVGSSYVVTELESVVATARRVLRVHQLRAADALQLAAALVWSGSAPEGRTIVTLDERLATAARREGFIVLRA